MASIGKARIKLWLSDINSFQLILILQRTFLPYDTLSYISDQSLVLKGTFKIIVNFLLL